MDTNKEQKKEKDNPQDKAKIKSQKKRFQSPASSNPKPFQQFSNPNKFSGGPPKSFNAFHRRLGK